MPDYSFISQNQQAPALQNAQGIFDLANKAIQIQSNQITLQRDKQLNQERIAKQQFTANPSNWQDDDGNIDLKKITSAYTKFAPLSGPEDIAKFTELATAQTGAQQAKLKFTNDQRNIVGSLYGVLGRAGVTDPKVIASELDNLSAQYPNSPEIHKYVENAKVGLQHVQPGPGVTKTLVTQAQSLLSPMEQQAALSPSAGGVDNGAQQVEVIKTPAVGGNPPSITPTGRTIATNAVPPTQAESTKTDALGNPYVETKTPSGQIGAKPAPGSSTPPLLQLPPGETKETAGPLMAMRQETNQAASKVPDQHFNNQQIIRLAPQALTGAGGEGLAKMLGAVGIQATNDKGADTAQLNHFMALQTENNAKAMGANTDAARAISERAAGSAKSPEQAIIRIAKINDAYATGLEMFNKGLESAINHPDNKKSIFAARDFQNQWAQTFDPTAMLLHNAIVAKNSAGNAKEKLDAQKDIEDIVKSVGGKGSAGAQTLARKYQAIERLSGEGR